MKIDMVFEGGGAKGMVFIGAMKELENRGHTPGRLVGTSAGAITAALLAAGYSADEMQEALDERKADVVKLRVIWGLKMEEIAESLGVSVATVERDWSFSRAWLTREASARRERDDSAIP